MAYAEVTIWNLALSAAGGRVLISDPTESGREADLCRLWYPLVRDGVLKAASWPSVKTYERLAVSAERTSFETTWVNTNPAPTWKYAYLAPSDMIAPIHLADYTRFERAVLDDNVCIMTNTEQAILHYLRVEENPEKWDTGLRAAIVHSLAAALVIPLSGKLTLARHNEEKAEQHVLFARTDIANESDDRYEALPLFFQQRGFSEPPSATRYIFPYADLNVLAL